MNVCFVIALTNLLIRNRRSMICFSEVCALLFDPKYNACDHDWFKTTRAAKPWTFGVACHGLFLSALKQICPLTAADTEEALRDQG